MLQDYWIRSSLKQGIITQETPEASQQSELKNMLFPDCINDLYTEFKASHSN